MAATSAPSAATKVRVYHSPTEVRTGIGARSELPMLCDRLGAKRPVVICCDGVAKSGTLKLVTDVFEKAGRNVPTNAGIRCEPDLPLPTEIFRWAKAQNADLLIGVGGGSVIDTGKVVAWMFNPANPPPEKVWGTTDKVPARGLPTIFLPTTAGTGSEVTNIAIFYNPQSQLKQGIVTQHNFADIAIVDPELTLTLPARETAATGLDALCHSVECMISTGATPMTDALALQSIVEVFKHLLPAVRDGKNLAARAGMMDGVLMASISFGNAGVCGVHAMSYPLGGTYHVPHGESNALMMVEVLRYLLPACTEKLARMGRAIGVGGPNSGGYSADSDQAAATGFLNRLDQYINELKVPRRLRDVGVPENALESMTEGALAVTRLMVRNPREITREAALQIYRNVY
ncbi:MAG TPA: iron-containing alcohol dehydrogenase [Planctomycetota bacterium]|jgi:alcohol dehydrogenase class IV|nr:iron-containing alcohol dehydrogenase [Planctomycetota bacterium]